MPSFTSLVLTDRAATPANHTFLPRSNRDGVALVTESNGTPAADKRFSISTRRVNGKLKRRIVFQVPVVQTETINGISRPKVVRESIVDATFTFSEDSSEDERDDVVGMFASSLDASKALVNDTIVKAEEVFS